MATEFNLRIKVHRIFIPMADLLSPFSCRDMRMKSKESVYSEDSFAQTLNVLYGLTGFIGWYLVISMVQ